MSSTYSGQKHDFDLNKYLAFLKIKDSEKVPENFFNHVSKSELNGIELGAVVEVENEDERGYWFASVSSSKGILINLHYFGDENDKHDFWLVVKSPRIHPLNWGSENNKKLIPPSTTRFKHVNLKTVKDKVQDCEHIVSNIVLKMEGAPIYNIFKPGMFLEVQDDVYPYRVWVSKVLKNVGGRLLLQRTSCTENPFWLFYLNGRIFPLGWAEQKGLPWRVMNIEDTMHYDIDSSSLINVLKPKTTEQHSFKVGEMLEVKNPYSLMDFYVATIVKIYDNRYFQIELDNDKNINKRTTFLATKNNPYLFNAGWASKNKCVLKPPSDWKASEKFCWSEYITIKNSKLAYVDNARRKSIDNLRVGMKLEAVDPVNPDCIRLVTIKGFADHWMFLAFDRSSRNQELLQVHSIYSDEIFPVGWCFKHKHKLNISKSLYNSIYNYEKCAESSNKKIEENGEYILQETVVETELPELDEEFHVALFSEVEEEKEVDTINKDIENEIANREAKIENSDEKIIDYEKDPCKTLGGPIITKNAKRKIDSNDFENIEYCGVSYTAYEKIRRIAAEELDWSNKPLVGRFKYYMATLINFDKHFKTLSQCPTQNVKALVNEILYKKNCLRLMDKNDMFSNTKSELNDASDGIHFNYIDNWKCSYENHYRQDSRFKNDTIDIGDFHIMEVLSNPKYWTPEDVYNYLSSDSICLDVAKKLMATRFDGFAFMLLTEKLLMHELKCSINIVIRVLCHVAEVRFICSTKYRNT